MTARTRLGLTFNEVAARARALEAQQDARAERGDDPEEEFVSDMLVDRRWDAWNHHGGHFVTPSRRDPFVRRMAEVEAEHLLEQVFPGRLPAAWSRLPCGDAIDRLIDQAAELDGEVVRRLAAEGAFGPQLDRVLAFRATLHSIGGNFQRSAAWFARAAAGSAAWNAAWNAAPHPALDDIDAARLASDAARDCASALIVADLADERCLTSGHVDLLLEPWVTVVGDPREA